ncbi:protein THYLAKOID ASSEMBLY 8-like, chloroplastic [Spinacia oleracea]|uniref:Protein THYLAKOID ASSEMBLY 8-like, chloroplastic n=1 Tax=Spinacia oleracea TaxID=3562 RepID=A0A9R0JSP4_SPIOL|nr:protein THYLAKOID ASSEMBLY 8-like, chloroplastic [Spinacia oleracea]
MSSLKFQFTQFYISQTPQNHTSNQTHAHFPIIPHLNSPPFKRRTRTITCGLRKIGPRKPLWRSSFLSTEAIQAVQSLKLAKSPVKLQQVFNTRITRLLKADLLGALSELQRQNHLDLALKVFDFVKKEYTADLSLYYDMILLLGKNKLIQKAEELFDELKKEGLQPDVRAYTELIGAYFQVDMVEKAMETYNEMKASGFTPDKLTLMIMVRNLEKAGEQELAASVKRDFEEYVDEPERFLQQVEKNYSYSTDL